MNRAIIQYTTDTNQNISAKTYCLSFGMGIFWRKNVCKRLAYFNLREKFCSPPHRIRLRESMAWKQVNRKCWAAANVISSCCLEQIELLILQALNCSTDITFVVWVSQAWNWDTNVLWSIAIYALLIFDLASALFL